MQQYIPPLWACLASECFQDEDLPLRIAKGEGEIVQIKSFWFRDLNQPTYYYEKHSNLLTRMKESHLE